MRIRPAGALVIIETAPDGVSFVQRASTALPAFATPPYAYIGVSALGADAVTGTFDNFRVTRGACDGVCAAPIDFNEFTDGVIEAAWNPFAEAPLTVAEANGALRVTVPVTDDTARFAGVFGTGGFDAFDATFTAHIPEPPVAAGNLLYGGFASAATEFVGFAIFDGTLSVEIRDGARFDRAFVPFDPAQHVFMRVTTDSAGDRVLLSTSPDGIAFTELNEVPLLPPFLTSCVVSIGAGSFAIGNAGTMSFGSVDAAPAECR